MISHTRFVVHVVAILTCLAPVDGSAAAPTELEIEVQSLYESAVSATSRPLEAEVPPAVQGLLPTMQMCVDVRRPDLLATCYKTMLTLNAGRRGLLSIAMPRALNDLQRADPEFDEPRSFAAVTLQFVGDSDRETARTALLDAAANDSRGYVIQFALDGIRALGGSNDNRVYHRFIETPGLDPQIIFPERAATNPRNDRIALRAAAMTSRFPAGTFVQDVHAFPALDEEGRLAAVSAISAYLWSRTPAEAPPCGPEDTQNCVAFLVANIGDPNMPVPDRDLQYVRSAAFALSLVAPWTHAGRFDPISLDLIETDLPVLRQTILARDPQDPRIAFIDEAIDAAGKARAHP